MFSFTTSDRADRGFLVLLLILAVFYCVNLDSYPLVWVDEPWESITAYRLITDGRIYNPVLEGRAGWDEVFLEPRMLLTFLVGGAFAFFGPGIIQGRLVSVLFGLLLVSGVYVLGKRIVSPRAALLASWCLAVETMIFIGSRTIRPDIYVAFFDVTVILLILRAQNVSSGANRYFGLAGALTGIALWTHPNALLILASAMVLFVAQEGRTVFLAKRFWVFSLSALSTFLPYLLYLIIHDAENSFSRFWLQMAGRPEDLVQSNWLLTSLSGEVMRVLEYMRFPNRLFAVLAFFVPVVWAFRSDSVPVRSILIVIAVHFVVSFLLLSNKTVLYSTSVLPFLALLCGAYFDRYLPRLRQIVSAKELRTVGLDSFAAVFLFLSSSLTQLGGTAHLLWTHRSCSYAGVIDALRAAIPGETRVWGSMTFWFAFYEQPYRSQYTYLRELESFRPEYMILGDRETGSKEHWAEVRSRAEEIVRRHGSQVALIKKGCYGELRVYKMQWD